MPQIHLELVEVLKVIAKKCAELGIVEWPPGADDSAHSPKCDEETWNVWWDTYATVVRWIHQRTGISREDLEEATFRVGTPAGLGEWKRRTGSEIEYRDLQWILPKLHELSCDPGAQADLRKILSESPVALAEIESRAGVRIETSPSVVIGTAQIDARRTHLNVVSAQQTVTNVATCHQQAEGQKNEAVRTDGKANGVRRPSPGSEKWRKAQKLMRDRLKKGTLPATLREAAKAIEYSFDTTRRAAWKSDLLRKHFKLTDGSDDRSGRSQLLDELAQQADPATRRCLENLPAPDRERLEADCQKMSPGDALEMVKVLANDPDRQGARWAATLGSEERDPSSQD